jgi:2-keto-3-deoxy-6-phosphogluconate aldolase
MVNNMDNSTENIENKKRTPNIESKLRHNIVRMPEEIRKASGIVIWGRRIKSLVFTTDIAIIRNCDADAVLAVYPFTPQQAISSCIIQSAYIPVFCGVGGSLTKGLRSITMAKDAEAIGAMGVVVNAAVSNANLAAIAAAVDIPVVATVITPDTDVGARIASGASILNVSAAADTPEMVERIRRDFPDVPIIATGGPTPDSVSRTVAAGANAVSITPPSTKALFSEIMKTYRSPDGGTP